MPQDTPSLRTEAALIVQRVAANHPAFVNELLKELQTSAQVREKDNARGATVALRNLRTEINFWEKSKRDSLIKNGPAQAPEPSTLAPTPEPPRPLTMTERLMAHGRLPRELSGDEILNGYDPTEGRQFLRINKDQSRLGAALGEYLHDLSQKKFGAYFEEMVDKGPVAELGKRTADPVRRVDENPFLLSPKTLVQDGEGPDFNRTILVVESFTLTLPNGVLVKRDFRINDIPALKTHPQLIKELDGNLKIRSTVKKLGDKEFAFYAKALWAKEGDLIYGYMEIRTPNGEEDCEPKFLRVSKGAIISLTKDQFLKLGGHIPTHR